MVDFKKAIAAGLQAHEIAEVARREVAEVVADLASQMSDSTDQVLTIEFSQGTRQSLKQFAGAIVGMLGPEPSVVTYANLVLTRNDEPKASLEICEVDIHPSGYPVLVAGPGKRENCYDRASFEAALFELLKHPDTGRKISQLMSVTGDSPRA